MSNIAGRTIAWIEKQGITICKDPAEIERLKSYIVPAAELFPDLVNMLCAVYVYRMNEQSGDAAGVDGILWKNVTSDSGTVYAVGISTEAMDKGADYTAFLFLHELAHITTDGDHSRAFHDQLNELLMVYNEATGANLANDMFGQQMRYDSRPFVLPDNIPIQYRGARAAFRMEAKQ